MATAKPTINDFLFWYSKYQNGECTKEYARQKVCFKQWKWRLLCKDYENGADIKKYF